MMKVESYLLENNFNFNRNIIEFTLFYVGIERERNM